MAWTPLSVLPLELIVTFLLELILVKLDDLRREQLEKAKADNLANYNKLITGQTQLSNTINASKNIFGKITFKNQ